MEFSPFEYPRGLLCWPAQPRASRPPLKRASVQSFAAVPQPSLCVRPPCAPQTPNTWNPSGAFDTLGTRPCAAPSHECIGSETRVHTPGKPLSSPHASPPSKWRIPPRLLFPGHARVAPSLTTGTLDFQVLSSKIGEQNFLAALVVGSGQKPARRRRVASAYVCCRGCSAFRQGGDYWGSKAHHL